MILVVEDEPEITMGLRDALEFEGFDVVTAATGAEGVQSVRQAPPDAVLLDLMLPDINGYQVCEEIRQYSASLPIIMLTAKSQEADKIRGLNAGADDYVTKPFGVGELVARLRALFRRTHRPSETISFEVGVVTVNLSTHSIQRGRRVESLSFYEVELLRLLYERQGQPVSREDILNKIWGIEATPSNRTIDNFIVKLRKKLEERSDRPKHILTVYGMGYKLVI